jgi:hypothetical protein
MAFDGGEKGQDASGTWVTPERNRTGPVLKKQGSTGGMGTPLRGKR